MVADDVPPAVPTGGDELRLASSSLLGAQPHIAAPVSDGEASLSDGGLGHAKAPVRYDPLAQLLGSDTDDDTEATDGGANSDSDAAIEDKENSPVTGPLVPLAVAHTVHFAADTEPEHASEAAHKRRPFSAARFALHKNVKEDSVVARLASSRRGRAVSDSEGEEEDVALFDGPRQRTMSSLRLDSGSDSDLGAPPPSAKETKKPRAARRPRSSPTKGSADAKPRAASKAAISKLRQETERLVRETAVIINPMDYTQRLALEDFFARYDLHASQAGGCSVPSPPKHTLPPCSFQYESDSGEYDVEIVDDTAGTPLGGTITSPSIVKKPAGDLDAMLDYGSQPLHSSARLSASIRRTDGPIGLKQLNGALMVAMYKQDEEALRERAKSSAVAETAANADEAFKAHAETSDGDEVAAPGLLESDASGSDGGDYSDDDVGSESEMESEAESDEEKATQSSHRRQRRAAVDSDDEDDGDSGARSEAKSGAAEADTDPGKKAKFLGMFRMPVKDAVTKPMQQPLVLSQRLTPRAALPSTPEQPQPLSASQDLSYLFSSQIGQIGNTQDSLLMTPVEALSNRQIDYTMDTQMSTDSEPPFGPRQMCAQNVDAYGVELPQFTPTQATQMLEDDQEMQHTLETQLATATGSSAHDDVLALPTMVRRALEQAASDSDARAPAAEAVVLDASGDGHDPSLPQPQLRPGRLLRRSDLAAQRRHKRRDKRSEFVEAEAEEGDSSESDGDEAKAAGPRKFSWGNGEEKRKAADESDESEDDMDSEEEEAALLADPMINNEVDSDEGEEAVRSLHRQREFDEDERNIQELYNDITTGALKNRASRNRTGFALADDEDYNDRQSRVERMEERARMQRRLRAREIHDKDLAEIARNPETAAFARAALMRPPVGPDGDDMLVLPGDDAFALEEHVEDCNLAITVQQQLMRSGTRIDSDDDDADPPVAATTRPRIASSSQAPSSSMVIDDFSDLDGADAFVAVEKLIVRRRTLLAAGNDDGSTKLSGGAAIHHRVSSSLLKRPGATLLNTAAKRLSLASAKRGA
ncbi:hypothetical protein H4R26_000178 [Coemansia thaxteri]|uniref:DNA replication checkpoint mediator MRC1 domain-containing protein n=1 Tax=Coemansia thaxteri TaxID=2663907 RepID=A0A9W8EMD8_9FUNG|nr:hypothetical protein H4R26_000178 [Coemansia thaxteri]KAJ2487900.1 hypothetical protein EV174_000247 [Coemansia sp. RSA 2320]